VTDDPRHQAMLVAHEQLLVALLREIARNDAGVADRLAADLEDLADRALATGDRDEAMLSFVELVEGYVRALRRPDGWGAGRARGGWAGLPGPRRGARARDGTAGRERVRATVVAAGPPGCRDALWPATGSPEARGG
jgi:hypothetical protein